MSGVRVLSFRRRLSAFEPGTMPKAAGTAGINNAILVDTCAAAPDLDRLARQASRRLRRDNPAARPAAAGTLASGCAARTGPGMKQVHAGIGAVGAVEGRARAFVQLFAPSPRAGRHGVLVGLSSMAQTGNFTPEVAQDAPRGQMALIEVTGCDANHLTGDLVDAAADIPSTHFARG